MEKLCLVKEVREAEAAAVAQGITLHELMARAGLAVAQTLEELVGQRRTRLSEPPRVLFLVGPGNNGGDGLVAAGHLAAKGWQCWIWPWKRAEPGDLPIDQSTLQSCRWLGNEDIFRALSEADIVVDALFGIGGRSELPDEVRRVYQAAALERQRRGTLLVAVDVPSGIDSDSGAADEGAFPADLTVMLGLPKVGAYRAPALRYTGLIHLVKIGLPKPSLGQGGPFLITKEDVRQWLPRRPADSHKWAVGAIMIVGGAPNYYGAPRLAASAALRSGAGIVTLSVPRSLVSALAPALAEVTFLPAPDGDVGAGLRWAELVQEVLPRYRVLLLGPGLGQDRPAEEVVHYLLGLGRRRRGGLGFAPSTEDSALSRFTGYAVIDADGLNLLAKVTEWWSELREAQLILTPHPGELARLTDQSVASILDDPWSVAREAAQLFGHHVVLKYGHTVVATPDGELILAPQIHGALATAGTGDVLAGVIAGLAAQGLRPREAAAAGVFVANQAALAAIARKGTISLLASDIVEALPEVMMYLVDDRYSPVELLHEKYREGESI